eukprot:2412427-Amphidinium_carterae.2
MFPFSREKDGPGDTEPEPDISDDGGGLGEWLFGGDLGVEHSPADSQRDSIASPSILPRSPADLQSPMTLPNGPGAHAALAIEFDTDAAQPFTVQDTAGDGPATDGAPQPLAREGGRVRVVHEDSFRWGGFYFTYSSPEVRPPHGAWSVVCPYHAKNAKTDCSKSCVITSEVDSKAKVRDLLKLWCLQATTVNRKDEHSVVAFKHCDVPAADVLEARLAELPQPPARADVVTDEMHDREAAAPAPVPKGRAKAKTKAKSKARAKPKPSPSTSQSSSSSSSSTNGSSSSSSSSS